MKNSNKYVTNTAISQIQPCHEFVLDNKAEDRLRTYLLSQREGNFSIVTAPFGKGKDFWDILQEWSEYLHDNLTEPVFEGLLKFEDDMKAKVGPMSIRQPLKKRVGSILEYYEDVHLSSVPVLERAINQVKLEFKPITGIRLRSRNLTVEQMKKSSNSGLPSFIKRRIVSQETLKHSLSVDDAGAHFMGKTMAAVLGWRGQEGGRSIGDVKQRVIWMFPFSVNIEELRVYQPLIEAAQRFSLIPAWVNMDVVDQRVTQLFNTTNEVIVCTDFTGFDQHFNQDMQNSALSILRGIVSGGDEWLNDIFPIKYKIPMIYDQVGHDLKLYSGFHGMASGSGGTNADETLAHRSLQHEAAIYQNSSLNLASQCLGDDGILSFNNLNVDKLLDTYAAHGQEMNKIKQHISYEDCVYLRRWHHRNYQLNKVCVGVYSTCRALGRLKYMERFIDPEVWGSTMVALRQISIIENTKYHPLFNQFVQFCMKRDKYRLGLDIPGFLDNIEKLAEEAIDYMPDFMGYTKSLGSDTLGIRNWAVVKLLKSYR